MLTAEVGLDEAIDYPMLPWAKTIGGILKVNGFTDFLRNHSAVRRTADPIREAIGILAFHCPDKPLRAADVAQVAVAKGLEKILLPGVNSANTAACGRQIGKILSPYDGERFTVRTASEQIIFLLKKESKRWNGQNPHYRYTFEEISRELANDEPHGLVLEETMTICGIPTDLEDQQPEANP